MTAILAFLRFLRFAWPYIVCCWIGFGVGGYLEGNRWEAKYGALQASAEQGLADAQAAARKALQAQLDQFQATATHNAQVINDLQNQTNQALADRAHDRDLVQRLLNVAAQRDPNRYHLPETPDQPATPAAGPAQSDGQLGSLLIETADECRANARQLNALIQEIQPQL